MNHIEVEVHGQAVQEAAENVFKTEKVHAVISRQGQTVVLTLQKKDERKEALVALRNKVREFGFVAGILVSVLEKFGEEVFVSTQGVDTFGKKEMVTVLRQGKCSDCNEVHLLTGETKTANLLPQNLGHDILFETTSATKETVQ